MYSIVVIALSLGPMHVAHFDALSFSRPGPLAVTVALRCDGVRGATHYLWVAGLDGTTRSRSEHEVTKWQTGKPARRWNGIRFG